MNIIDKYIRIRINPLVLRFSMTWPLLPTHCLCISLPLCKYRRDSRTGNTLFYFNHKKSLPFPSSKQTNVGLLQHVVYFLLTLLIKYSLTDATYTRCWCLKHLVPLVQLKCLIATLCPFKNKISHSNIVNRSSSYMPKYIFK